MSLFDFTGELTDFATEVVTVTRAAATTIDAHGVAQAGSPSTFTTPASVQAVPGRDLLRLPEGFRTRELRVFFTSVQLKSVDTAAATPADRVQTADGSHFEIQECRDRSLSGGYYRSIGMRVEL